MPPWPSVGETRLTLRGRASAGRERGSLAGRGRGAIAAREKALVAARGSAPVATPARRRPYSGDTMLWLRAHPQTPRIHPLVASPPRPCPTTKG